MLRRVRAALKRAVRALATELDAQILPDGGHVGRNPADLLDLLLDLLPLRPLFASRSLQVPPALDRALDRMLPMIRFFRHGSGDLALFNGMGRTPGPEIAAVLAADRSRNAVLQRASASGYDRIEAGGTLAIVETGAGCRHWRRPRPPMRAALAFELSSGLHRIVVNCGAASGPERVRNASRQTAAHPSTLSVLDVSSALALDGCEPLAQSPAASYLLGRFGPVLLPGPRDVGVERGRSGDDIVLLGLPRRLRRPVRGDPHPPAPPLGRRGASSRARTTSRSPPAPRSARSRRRSGSTWTRGSGRRPRRPAAASCWRCRAESAGGSVPKGCGRSSPTACCSP